MEGLFFFHLFPYLKSGESHREALSGLLTTGMAGVTPSPLSMMVPVNVRPPTCRDVHEAAKASTAWTGHGSRRHR